MRQAIDHIDALDEVILWLLVKFFLRSQVLFVLLFDVFDEISAKSGDVSEELCIFRSKTSLILRQVLLDLSICKVEVGVRHSHRVQ